MIRIPEADRLRLKRQAPSSMFTKTGPGVRAKAQRWFQRLSNRDRLLVVAMGWVPAVWSQLPHRPAPILPFVKEMQREQPAPGMVKKLATKVWSGLKRLFGRKGES